MQYKNILKRRTQQMDFTVHFVWKQWILTVNFIANTPSMKSPGFESRFNVREGINSWILLNIVVTTGLLPLGWNRSPGSRGSYNNSTKSSLRDGGSGSSTRDPDKYLRNGPRTQELSAQVSGWIQCERQGSRIRLQVTLTSTQSDYRDLDMVARYLNTYSSTKRI